MATEAYIPTSASFRGQPIDDPIVFTMYKVDTATPHGSLTTPRPLSVGDRGGPLVVLGTRDKKQWQVTLTDIEVRNKTAVGFEYAIHGPIERTLLAADEAAKDEKVGPRLENLGATF